MSKFCRATSIASWTRRVAAAAAATVAVTAAGMTPAHAADAESAVILNSSVSHQVIDVVDGPVQVTVRLEVQDLGSGVAAGYPLLEAQPPGGPSPIPAQTMTLVSGDRFKGMYETTFTFPELIRGGVWNFQPRIFDLAGNDYNPPSGDYDNIGIYPTVVSVPDTTKPTVTTSLSANIVDITDGPAKVVVTANAYDGGIGFRSDAYTTFDYSDRTRPGGYIYNSSTDPHRATFTTTYEYPKFGGAVDARGSYTYAFKSIADTNGNGYGYNPVGTTVVATRPLRAKLPVLNASIGTVTATWAAHTDVLGILEYETEFAGAGTVRTARTTATEATLNDLPTGTYTARVRARNRLGWGEWTSSSAAVEYSLAPMTKGTPTVSGTVQVGQTLTADPGIWTPGTTLAYQWQANGVAVPGATGSTLVLGPVYAGKSIAVLVTGSKPGHITTSSPSAATAPVVNGELVGATPSITGTAAVGSTLTAVPGTWGPAPVTLAYQWKAGGAVILGATGSTYKPASAYVGKTLTVTVTGSTAGFANMAKTSAATAVVVKGSLVGPTPQITGTAKVGSTLTASTGTWSPSTISPRYQWYRSGVAIIGATAAVYKPTSADVGKTLTFRVTAYKIGYTTAVKTSAVTAAVVN